MLSFPGNGSDSFKANIYFFNTALCISGRLHLEIAGQALIYSKTLKSICCF